MCTVEVHMRSDRGLPTNITTVLFENLHWDCRPSAFFMPVFHFMPLFCIYQVFFAGGRKLFFFINNLYNIRRKSPLKSILTHVPQQMYPASFKIQNRGYSFTIAPISRKIYLYHVCVCVCVCIFYSLFQI